MAVIPAVVTDDARQFWPQMFGGLVTYKIVAAFRVGEGGWVNPGSGREPRTPDASLRRLDNGLQDIDAIVDATRAPADQRYAADERATYEKSLVASDFSFVSPTKLEVRCFLDRGEFNDDGYGNSPEIWELGVFSEHPTIAGQLLMLGYGTFPMQVKTSGISLLNIMRFVF